MLQSEIQKKKQEAEAAGSTKLAEAIFKEADAETVLKVLFLLPLLPNIMLTFLLKLLHPGNLCLI